MREFTRKVTPLSEINVEKSIDQIIDVANKGLGSSVAPHRFVLVDISLLLGLYEVYKNAAQQSFAPDAACALCQCENLTFIDNPKICPVCELPRR